MSKRLRVAHFGTFDVENYGDLLFPHLLERRLGPRGFDFVHVSPLGGPGVWSDGAPSVSFSEFSARLAEFDAVVVGGGNIVHCSPTRLEHYDVGGISPLFSYSDLWLGATIMAAEEGLPVAWNAPGVPEPLKPDPHGLVDWVLGRAKYIAVRDDSSLRNLCAAGFIGKAQVVPDTALEVRQLWSPPDLDEAYRTAFESRDREPAGRAVAFHFNSRYLEGDPELIASVVEQVATRLEATPVLLAIGPCHGDGETALEIGRLLDGRALVIDRPNSLREVAACISRSSAYLGSSLHGLVTATAFGVPGLIVGPAGRHKFEGFLSHVGGRGRRVDTWAHAAQVVERLMAKTQTFTARFREAAHRALDRHWTELEAALRSSDAPDGSGLVGEEQDLADRRRAQLELVSRRAFEALLAETRRSATLGVRCKQSESRLRELKQGSSSPSQNLREATSTRLSRLIRTRTPRPKEPASPVDISVVQSTPTYASAESGGRLRGEALDLTRKPRVLLLNDTSSSSNPGCKAAVDAIRAAYGVHEGNERRLNSLPLGYWADEFKPLATRSSEVIAKQPGRFSRFSESAQTTVSLEQWERVSQRMAEEDDVFQDVLALSDLVVINGEGSIHHNFPRALALLGLALAAATRGKPVHLVNCSLQGMEKELLQRVLPLLGFVHVREGRSSKLLDELGISHERTVDLAASARMDERLPEDHVPRIGGSTSCLLSSGVLVRKEALIEQITQIRGVGLEPFYLSMGDGGEDACAGQACDDLGVSFSRAADIPWRSLPDFLRHFECAVSGRHHLNLFLASAGVPFVPLPSNTWKVESTLESIEYPVSVAYSGVELGKSLRRVVRDRAALAQRARHSGLIARGSALYFARILWR